MPRHLRKTIDVAKLTQEDSPFNHIVGVAQTMDFAGQLATVLSEQCGVVLPVQTLLRPCHHQARCLFSLDNLGRLLRMCFLHHRARVHTRIQL